MNVLAERWNSGELADEIEVSRGQGMNSTAVIHRQRLLTAQCQVLDGKQHKKMRRNTETKVFMNSLLNHVGHNETKD